MLLLLRWNQNIASSVHSLKHEWIRIARTIRHKDRVPKKMCAPALILGNFLSIKPILPIEPRILRAILSMSSYVEGQNRLVEYLDSQPSKTPPGSPKLTPTRSPGRAGEAARADKNVFGKKTKSTLLGWSPSGEEPVHRDRVGSFSLGPNATEHSADAPTNMSDKPPASPPLHTVNDTGGGLNEPKREFKKLPKLTKAERRAKQEGQRAAKAASGGKPPSKTSGQPRGGSGGGRSVEKGSTRKGGDEKGIRGSNESTRHGQRKPLAISLFSHLPQYSKISSSTENINFSNHEAVHPAIVRLGLKFASWEIGGSNARCISLLLALKEIIWDYSTPPNEVLSRHLVSHLKPNINFIVSCRPLSSNMGNAINSVKASIANIGADMRDDDAKELLCEDIDNYILRNITKASERIIQEASKKIVDGDVILTYGRSFVVEKLLEWAQTQNKKFRVVIVDSRPVLEGRGLLSRLGKCGIKCTYVLMNSVSYVMKEVTKVFLGASGMMANGAAAARVGTAMVSMMAHDYRKPVIFCCETYKFTPRVQLDSIVDNELLDPQELARTENGHGHSPLDGWEDIENLTLLSIGYDVTPSKFITMIVSENGMLPPTSVPVIIREFLLDKKTF